MKCFLSAMLLACLPLACAPGVHSAGRNYTDPAVAITVNRGEVFTISLESNRTTGYRWVLDQEPDGKVVRYVGTEYRPADSRLAGAGGLEIWTFEAVNKGSAVICLHYLRPWEKGIPAVRKAEFPVLVK
jgi:inhibitor of cysteine peptidase